MRLLYKVYGGYKMLAYSNTEDAKKRIEEFTRAKGALITEGNVDSELVREIAKKKAEMEILRSQLKQIEVEYDVLKDKLEAQLPGETEDKIELLIDGIMIKRHPRLKRGAKLNSVLFEQLARRKKIYGRVTKTIKVFDEESILTSLVEGDITYEEYIRCIDREFTTVLRIENKSLAFTE
jgi:Rps23 Pro-64 3,4-dihydroxylase Tpa1-like proline 4-hydroxylase